MKKIIKPARKEVSEYFSDFTGESFGEFGPPIELKLSFGYGSDYDGANITLHLDDTDFHKILKVIKNLMSSNSKQAIKNFVENLEKNYDDSMQMRDWDACDLSLNCLALYRKILEKNN